MTRRDWLKLTASSGGALLLPNVTGLLASAQGQRGGRATTAPAPSVPGRERLLADFGWKFHLGHADDPTKDFNYGRNGAFAKSGSFLPGGGRGSPSIAQATFDDADWTSINLPHDWAVDLPFVEDRSVNGHGAKPLGRAYPETSIGWYRRVFEIPASDRGRRIAIEFDGVFRDATVVLNGHYIGRNLSGYAPARYDVTDFVTYGTTSAAGQDTPGRNVLLVRVDATESEGWFYEGAGIYRHVWLEKTSPAHVGHWGTFVTTEMRRDAAIVTVRTEVVNDADAAASCAVVSKVIDRDGHTVATSTAPPLLLAGWTTRLFTQEISVPNAHLWSIDDPTLYRLETTIESGGRPADNYVTPFGIRTITFDADTGLHVNGAPVKIKGTCNHQDHAGVGSGLPDRLQTFRIARLKEMGANAYRTSHNPPTPELLDACDRLGMLVLDETRMMSSTDEGLSQFERMIRRDRNHPSVFCWSIGNEEPEQGTERGAREAATMKRVARTLDPSRLVTEAMNNSWGRGLSAVVDVQGFNYGSAQAMDDYHAQHPKQFAMGTEVASTVSTRGIYENDPVKGYVSSYDVNKPAWGATAEGWWTTCDARPWLAGGFVWTGFDYRGEPTPYGWPCISSHFGLMDTCGFAKDLFYYYQAWWTDRPVLHLFPHWNWAGKEGHPIDVWVFSNLERVELFVNGTSAGAQSVTKNSHLSWKVPFAPGTIEARGTKAGQPDVVVRRETTGAAAKLVVTPDRPRIPADGEDLAIVTVQVVDAQNRLVPTAGPVVTFSLTGGGRIIGVGNGDPSCHEADRAKPGDPHVTRSAFNGLCMAIVQATEKAGDIQIEASSPGLTSGSAVIAAENASPRPALG